MVVMTTKMATSENKNNASHCCTIRGWVGHSNYKTVKDKVTQVTLQWHKCLFAQLQ